MEFLSLSVCVCICVRVEHTFVPIRLIHDLKLILFFMSCSMLNEGYSEIALANRKRFFMPWLFKALHYLFGTW